MIRGYCCLFVLTVCLVSPTQAGANGGTIQVASPPAGPYLLTVFTSPNPIRVGKVDISILVQQADGSIVENARVLVAARPVGREGKESVFEATHDLATNKLYYAAHIELPEEGRWQISTRVDGDRGEGSVEFQVEASRASLLDTPLALMALMAAPILLAAGGWALVNRRAAQRGPN